DGKMACVVLAPRSPRPVYVRDGEERHLFVRDGNSTRRLNSEEAVRASASAVRAEPPRAASLHTNVMRHRTRHEFSVGGLQPRLRWLCSRIKAVSAAASSRSVCTRRRGCSGATYSWSTALSRGRLHQPRFSDG